MDRLKSPVVITGIITVILITMSNYGLYDYIGMPEGTVRDIINILLGLLNIVAIGNNPTDKENY